MKSLVFMKLTGWNRCKPYKEEQFNVLKLVLCTWGLWDFREGTDWCGCSRMTTLRKRDVSWPWRIWMTGGKEEEIRVPRNSMGRDSGWYKCDSFQYYQGIWSDKNGILWVWNGWQVILWGMWILLFRYQQLRILEGSLDNEQRIIGSMWTDKTEKDMKARDQANVTKSFLLETRIIKDENVWLVISGQVSKICQLGKMKEKSSVVCLSFTPSFLQKVFLT